jgi:hypothetical protein
MLQHHACILARVRVHVAMVSWGVCKCYARTCTQSTSSDLQAFQNMISGAIIRLSADWSVADGRRLPVATTFALEGNGG